MPAAPPRRRAAAPTLPVVRPSVCVPPQTQIVQWAGQSRIDFEVRLMDGGFQLGVRPSVRPSANSGRQSAGRGRGRMSISIFNCPSAKSNECELRGIVSRARETSVGSVSILLLRSQLMLFRPRGTSADQDGRVNCAKVAQPSLRIRSPPPAITDTDVAALLYY